MYVYKQTETAQETGAEPLYTVGYYHGNDDFEPESDHGGPTGMQDAVDHVHLLNGGGPTAALIARVERMEGVVTGLVESLERISRALGVGMKIHDCQDESATVVNGRWICKCPGSRR